MFNYKLICGRFYDESRNDNKNRIELKNNTNVIGQCRKT